MKGKKSEAVFPIAGTVQEMQKSAPQIAVIVARVVAALTVPIPAAAQIHVKPVAVLIRAMIAQWKHAAVRLNLSAP
jgi:hypothetical protein